MYLTESRKQLFSVLKDALWKSEETVMSLPSLNKEQVVELMEEAKKQTVHGLVLNRIDWQSYSFDKAFVFGHIGLLMQTQSQNAHMNEILVEFAKVMSEHGIDYVIVKGQSVGCYYPRPELRSSGDIDFYCAPVHYEKACRVLPEVLGVELGGEDSDHHLAFVWHDVHFEMHYALFDFYSKKKNRQWNELLNQAKPETFNLLGNDIKTLPATLHAFYVFLHIYEHLLELGVGLRQFCDFAVLLHYRHDDIDFKALQNYAEEFGMSTALKACGAILVDWLGLSPEEFPYELTKKDSRRAEKILDVVFYRGNMGKYNKRNGFHGWRHNIEATGIKLSHFMKFAAFSPHFCLRWIGHTIPRKLLMKATAQ